MKNKINICGVAYSIRTASESADSKLKDSFGYCDFATKKIVLNSDNCKEQNIKTTRHEIAHAFFYECGLLEYSFDEILVDFLAVQLPKIFALCNELNII